MSQMTMSETSILWLVGIGYVAIVIVSLIAYMLFRKTTSSLEVIVKGPFLPLVTVGVIVGASTLLAILGILKENAIAAIFGGIVGYVLGTLRIGYKRTDEES